MTNVAVAVIKRDEKYLICQRKKNGRYGLKWEFPGGKLEPDETVEQCLRRELLEELSIEIHSIKKIITESAFYDDGGFFNVHYCFISGFSREPKNNVFEQIRWVTLKELKEMDMLDGNKPIISKLKK